MRRTRILNFLQWNDRNGCYTDNNCIDEGFEPLTYVEAIKHFCYVMNDGLHDFDEVSVTQEFKDNPALKICLHYIMQRPGSTSLYREVIDISYLK